MYASHLMLREYPLLRAGDRVRTGDTPVTSRQHSIPSIVCFLQPPPTPTHPPKARTRGTWAAGAELLGPGAPALWGVSVMLMSVALAVYACLSARTSAPAPRAAETWTRRAQDRRHRRRTPHPTPFQPVLVVEGPKRVGRGGPFPSLVPEPKEKAGGGVGMGRVRLLALGGPGLKTELARQVGLGQSGPSLVGVGQGGGLPGPS